MHDPFLAIADPTRRAILRLLSRQELPAGQIAAAFPQQRPAISKHLTLLKRAGLISEARDRQQRLYTVRPEALTEVRRFLAELTAADAIVIHRAAAPATALPPLPRIEPRPLVVDEPALPQPARAAFSLEFD